MEEVATTTTYTEAERVVDHLSDQGLPVEKVSIVAHGLRLVEDVTGRASYGTSLVQGMVSGGVVGATLGFVFGLLSWVDPLVSGLALAAAGLVLGALAGAVIGVLSHWASGGRRDFSSLGRVAAERYDVMARADAAEEARRLVHDASQ